ncbi:MAG: ClpXP protease specificity-enhancing factor [Halioglobus sp.]|nr:stringent starvation protein B [marine gamma proteobacterium HTCC2148]MDG1388804.1 ClpXP protease specificity-enhancing factor [Halioglobus sp.]MDG2326625.1 ClpXP protease specificity-enhancing factor [Halioglobus sp.]
MSMTPSRPYIMRALYEWIVDNGCTPYILVDAAIDNVMVPEQYVKDDQIVLNISPTAVMELNISNDAVAFNGRFGGVATDIFVPVSAVIGIYARENGQGMVFEHEEEVEIPPDDTPPEPHNPEGRPSLKIVK